MSIKKNQPSVITVSQSVVFSSVCHPAVSHSHSSIAARTALLLMLIYRLDELNPCRRKKRWKITKAEMPSRRNTMVGASCLAIALPTIICQANHVDSFIMALLCVNAAFWSFLADYIFASNAAGSMETLGFDVHLVDRCSAVVSVGFFTFRLYAAKHVWQVIPLLGLLCLAFLYSRNAPTKESWFFRHTIWHAVLVAIFFHVVRTLHNSIPETRIP